MADNNVNETAIAGRDVGESSDTTIEIRIKTLDSHIHTLRVNRDMPVPVLKEQIAALTGVPLERQRLICRGKVLKDDQLLSDYHVEDGHTLHLVVRQPLPPSSSSTAGTSVGDGTSEQQGTDPTAGIGRNRNGQVAHNVVFGTFNLQDQGEGGFPDLNRILATVLNSIGIGNLSPANLAIGGGPTVMMQGNASDGRNQADSTAEVSQTGSQQPPAQAVPNAQSAPRSLNTPSPPQLHLSSQQMVIPNALTTLSHYLNHMVQAFSHHGYESQPHSFTSSTRAEDQMAASGMPSFLRGLPRPAALGSLVRHTQLLLSGPARNAFSVAETRFASHTIVLRRLVKVKEALKHMVISAQWGIWKNSNTARAINVRRMILDEDWWGLVNYVLEITDPIMAMLRFADSDQPCLGDIYDSMDSMLEKIKMAIQRRENDPEDTLYKKVEKIVHHRWNKMTTPLHLLAYALSPRYYSAEVLDLPGRVPPFRDAEVADGYKKALAKIFQDPEIGAIVRSEFAAFNSGEDFLPIAIADQSRMSAIKWWYLHGQAFMYLQPLAIKVLSQDLAGLLEGESAVTDTAIRAQIQSTVMHDGMLMQDLGALLLELGRATLTLQIGQSHDESVVNAGPAIYISSSGRNPIMVQPPPFQHGGSLGPFQTGFVNPTAGFTGGVSGAGEVPRNINIHIHSGPPVIPGGGLVTPANSDQGNQPNAPQSSGIPDQVGNVIAGSRETGAVRVVPVRTVVAAVPVRPPTEGNNATNNVFYPLLTTIQQLNSTQGVPIRGLAQATIGLQSNGIDGAQQQSIGTTNFNQAQANSILAQIQAQAQRFQGGMQNMGFQAQNVEGSIQTQNSLPVPAMSSAANTPVSVQHDTQNQSLTDQQVMHHGLSPENSATDINGSAMDGGDIVRNDNIGNVAVSGSNEMAYIANAVLQQMMGTYGRSGRANQQQSDQQQSNASPSSRNESTSMPNEPKSHVKQFEDKQDSSQLENTIMEMGSGVRSTDIDMQEYDLTSTSGKEIASTSCTNSQSKTVKPKSDSPKAVPAGLGLGGLQPPPSKKRAKPPRKLPENNDAAPLVNQDRELSTERGHNVQQDHFANSASNDHRTHENASSEQLSGGLAQMFGSMASGGRTGSGRVDIGNIMSQLLRTPAVNNILRGVAEQTGTVAPGELSNIIEQVTQSPVLRNTMQQMTERLGEHGEEIENAFSGMVGREGGIDFSRVMQQMMPIMSQVLGSVSGGTSFGLGSDAQLRGSDAQLRASNSEASTEDDHAANQNSQSNLEPTVQKLENHDPPQEVFRSMVENAMTLYRENDGSHNGVNTSEVLHQLSNTEDLANEYLAMLNRDLITRLQSDSGSAENS